MIHSPRRSALGLAAASVLTVAALSAIPASAGAAPAVPAAPTADCATPYNGSADDFAALVGTPVTGLTVLSGTTPGTFHGHVLGVLDQAIDLNTPLIMMQLGTDGITDGSTPSDVDKAITADGVWEGMSGSPVYTSTGQLIGAVSTGLAYGNSDIIGITPATSMLPFMPGGSTSAATGVRPTWRNPSTAMQHQLARVAGISQADAAHGLRPLTGLTERGLGAAALKHAPSAAKLKGLHKGLTTGRIAGVTGSATAPVSTMSAGGNMADMVVWGDYAEGGIGTVTTVCHGALVAFGHPLEDVGNTKDALMSANTVYVQPDPLNVAFKAANLGTPAGTISKDVNTAVGGTFGAMPSGTASFTNLASYDGGAVRRGVSYSADPNFWIDAAYYAADANDYTVMKASEPGGATVSFTIKGTDHGKPFTLAHTDRYASSGYIADDSLIDMGNLVYTFSFIPHVAITSVKTTSVLNDDDTVLHITGVQQKVGSSWKSVNAKHPVRATAGRTVSLRAVLTSPTGTTSHLPLTMSVPSSVKGGYGTIRLVGGNASDIEWSGNTVAAARSAFKQATHNDQVLVQSTFVKGKTHVSRTKNSSRDNRVIGGSRLVPIVVG